MSPYSSPLKFDPALDALIHNSPSWKGRVQNTSGLLIMGRFPVMSGRLRESRFLLCPQPRCRTQTQQTLFVIHQRLLFHATGKATVKLNYCGLSCFYVYLHEFRKPATLINAELIREGSKGVNVVRKVLVSADNVVEALRIVESVKI